MIFKKHFLPSLLAATGLCAAGHQAVGKTAVTPTVQNENTPTNLGAGMYLMKEGGMWASMMHLDASKAVPKKDLKLPQKPDLCVAGDQNQNLILRASAKGLEVRSVGKEWHLQKDILTSVKIAAGKYQANLTMQALGGDQIGVPVNLEQMAGLVEALSQSNQATITYTLDGKEKTKQEIRNVSLKMAAPVLNDFRECVRFSGFLHAKDKPAEKTQAKKA
ncbi:hypothetical protein FAI41_02815 [Acetobacteraceae bacterium]|nr:hypothetical protein FAI41_02815 [Acetobacteraceae bacterium]